jgi:uncharacterized protein YozE (UPF0346 family)
MKTTRKAFYTWLCRQREGREDAVGDFARDVFWDKATPRASENPDVWRLYCKKRKKPFLLAGFEQAWYEYINEHSDS